MHISRTTTSRDPRRPRWTFVAAALAAALVLALGTMKHATLEVAAAPAPPTAGARAASPATAHSMSGPRSKPTWPPTSQSVGIPDGTSLSTYRGGCTITRAKTVITRKIINCGPLHIKAVGVVIEDSLINGSIQVGTQDDFDPTVISDPEGDDPIRLTLSDSEVSTPADSDFRPISSSHYVVKRSYLHGTESGAECHNACTIKRSYVHGFGQHASGMRILRNGKLKHNTIWCEPNPDSDEDQDGVPDPDGGCSGNLVMYEEFGTPRNNVVRHNYFPAGLFYYSLKFNGADDGGIRIVDNRFGRPREGNRVADDWDDKPSNVWSGNTLTNGRVARP